MVDLMRRRLALITLASLLAMLPLPARAEVAEITTVAETSLIETFPNNNLGAESYVTCGNIQNALCGTTNQPGYCRNRALFKFNIAGAVPAGARIRSVRLVVWVSGASQDPDANALDLNIHRMLVPWTQGAGTNGSRSFPGMLGRPAEPGEPCWNFRETPLVGWGFPGGAPGVDYRPLVSGSISGIGRTLNEIYSTEATSGPLVEDVQFWLDHPESNHGWMFKGADENSHWTAKRLRTPESGSNYPRLEIDFVPRPRLEQVGIVSNALAFQFTAEGGQNYQVQAASVLDGGWLTLLNLPASPDTTNVLVLDPLPPTQTNRFFRVIAP